MFGLKWIRDKAFYGQVGRIMVPVALQQAIDMGVNMMDTIMLGQMGEAQLSASSLANGFYSTFNILCMGIVGGCSVLAAQYWGAGEKEKVRQTFNLALKLSACLALLFACVTAMLPGQIMGIYSTEPDVIAFGIKYLRITTYVYFFHGTSLVAAYLMRSVGKPQLGLYVSMLSFVVNVGANWVFIFGKLGAPRMEIAGAALGTLIARVAEFIAAFVFILMIDRTLALRPKDLVKKTSREIVYNYKRLGMAALFSDGLLGLGNNMLNIVLGRMGQAVVSANAICQVMDRLFTVVIQGISNAASVVTGNTIGAGNREKALAQGETFYLLSVLMGLVSSVLMIVFGMVSIRFYALAPETVEITKQMMLAYSVIILFQGIQSVMTKGVLRGGGDTRFLLVADILFMWILSLPLGGLVGLVLRAPGWVTILCLRADYVVKSVWCVSRLKSGKWIRETKKLNEV